MRYSNLHNHTVFSDGAHTVEENILEAIEKDMVSIGFSDHSYTPHEDSYCMQGRDYPAYLREIRAMQEKYADRIPVYAGLELDYYSEIPEPGLFDYIIASVHYLIIDGKSYGIDHSLSPDQTGCIEACGGDVLVMVQKYYDLLCEHVERCKPTMVGHFDVITKFGIMPEEDARYREIAGAALARVLKTCKYVEMNTGAISRGWRTVPYPMPYLLDTLRELGGEIVLNADSHHKDNLTCWFDQAVELLKAHGFDHINMFNGTGFDKVAI